MDRIEKAIVDTIEANVEKIIHIGRQIWSYPELGYKERTTSAMFARFCTEHGLTVRDGLAVTGVKGYLRPPETGGPTVALIGELDALPMSDSPYANPKTGAAHTCGHNAQMAGMMGALLALTIPEVKDALGGNVVFFAVPAEEYVEMEFKRGLMEQGAIGYGGGKSELIRVGAFDDIDLVLAHHIAVGHHPGNVQSPEQRLHEQDRPLHRRGVPRGGGARRGRGRAERRRDRHGGHQLPERVFPG